MYESKNIDDNVLLFSTGFLKQREYWKNQLTADVNDTEISFDHKYSPNRGTERKLKRRPVDITDDTCGRLMKSGKQADISIYILLVAALKSFIYRYSGNNDISVVSPVNKLKITKETINSFVFIRDYVRGDMSFKELVLKTRETLLQAYKHQDYPMGKFIEFLFRTPQGETGKFVSNILCSLNTLHSDRNIKALERKLSFLFEREGDRLTCTMSYDSGAYEGNYADQMAGHFSRILENTLRDINIKICDIEFLSPQEKEHLLFHFNDTDAPYPGDKTIQRLFEEQVEKTPDNIAVTGIGAGTRRMESATYRKLNERADLLARRLMEKGCRTGHNAAVMTDPVPEMMTAILAVLKTGACYLPIDPANPGERLHYLLTDSGAALLLTSALLADNVDNAAFTGEIITIDDESLYMYPGKGAIRETAGSDKRGGPAEPAYMIYTSGTTGNPKGVQVTHRNLVNYVAWFSAAAGVTGADRTLLTSSFAFDLGYTCIYPSLLKGAQLHLLPRETYMLPTALLNYIGAQRISYLKMTPSFFSFVIEDSRFSAEMCRTLRLIVLGGEAINTADVEKAYRLCSHLRIMNHYGPTEVTVGCIAQFVERGELDAYKNRPTIGNPIFNTKAFILDKHLNVLPAGVPGELCLNGAGVAKGYFKQEELTAEKFLELNQLGNGKTYRTGDLARRLPNGRIEFLGRVDHQVKLRGFRIELGEIESKLLRHASVKEAVVLAKENRNGDKYLCAYFVPPDHSVQNEARISELRRFLAGGLPDYMIPTYFMPIETIPLTQNGKLDRKSLPEPETFARGEYIAPRSEVERKLVEIWAEVLSNRPGEHPLISIDDNFFELGGQSLKAVVLISKIHKAFNTKLTLEEIFKAPNIRAIAEYIRNSETEKYASIEKAEEKDYYELSASQKGLYILQQLDERNIGYNMPAIFKFEGSFEKERLEGSFKKLIKRHESLRTAFVIVGRRPVQKIYDDVDFTIGRYDGGRESAGEIYRSFIRPFDLGYAPLLRVGLLEIENKEQWLMVDMHHIVSDGVSINLLQRDFRAIYEGKELPPLKLQYKDFSEWQNKILSESGRSIRRQEAFWLKEFDSETPALDFPTDFDRPVVKTFLGDHVTFVVEKDLAGKVRKIAGETAATLNMILLAVYYILLSKYSNREDIVVGSPVFGRRHGDLLNVIGLFVNMLALRAQPRKDKTFREFLAQVREKVIRALENQDYQFGQLAAKLGRQGSASGNPLFDVVFMMGGRDGEQVEDRHDSPLASADDDRFKSDNNSSVFDMIMTAAAFPGEIRMELRFSTTLFRKERIEKITKRYIDILTRVVEDIDIPLGDIVISHGLVAADSNIFESDSDTFGF